MKGIVFSLILLLGSVSMVSALDEDQVPLIATQYKEYDIKLSCDLSGYFCYTTTACNLSVIYPNSSLLINNKRMQTSGAHVNFTLTSAQTATLGRYFVDVKCNDPTSGLNGTSQGILYITPAGKILTEGENFILMGAVAFLVFLSIIFLLMALFLPNSLFKIFFLFLGLLFMVASLMVTINLLQNYVVNNESMTKGMEYIFIGLTTLGFAATIMLLVFTTVNVLKSLKQSARFDDG